MPVEQGLGSTKVRAVLFDFDGTLSTLRAGWEEVMIPFCKESIVGSAALSDEEDKALDQEIAAYIDQSTGIQTIYQMRWLEEKVLEYGWNPHRMDDWGYKAEYNRRLLLKVTDRVQQLGSGQLAADDYLMKGAAEMLHLFANKGVEMYVASGTDHPDVVREAEVLGVARFFESIAGAPVGRAECSKEKVMKDLLEEKGFKPGELAVVGDGRVEIELAKLFGGYAIGLASDESKREGINPVKEARLRRAGADWITGDFADQTAWITRLGL